MRTAFTVARPGPHVIGRAVTCSHSHMQDDVPTFCFHISRTSLARCPGASELSILCQANALASAASVDNLLDLGVVIPRCHEMISYGLL